MPEPPQHSSVVARFALLLEVLELLAEQELRQEALRHLLVLRSQPPGSQPGAPRADCLMPARQDAQSFSILA
eukprot:388663-Rhodomonas_salina.1